MRAIRLYIASSFRNLHAVRLFGRALCGPDFEILDWTARARPPEGLAPAERRVWMDTDHGGEVFTFCEQACRDADIVVYLCASGQDAGVEVGIAWGCGVPVLGVRCPLEAPGLMLYGAGRVWVEQIEEALALLRNAAGERGKMPDGTGRPEDVLLALYRERLSAGREQASSS